ncbi:MAG TPA: TMEM175 family protein [Candidatus Baltobacteraceae bacterium]|nr:TMEM175 family protein [Candidatus Baltobacteraceae bacterium]
MSKERFEAFSDGVFAFAITLLVLGIVLPTFKNPPSDHQVRIALLRLWPNVVAYALSFSVIGIMWQNHHAIFRLVDRVDRKTVALNLMLLAGTVFIPFATSTLGAYPTMHSSTFLYGVVLTYTATIYNLMLAYLIRKRAFLPSITPQVLGATVVAYRVGWATYALSTLLALWLPLASFAAYVLIAVYYLVPRGVDDDIAAA